MADDDFLRVDGTKVEGRSASEVLSDIGGQASLTFGISNTNAVKIDSSSVADDEYARFTANGLESRATSEVLSDIGAQASLTFGISNTNAVKIDSSSVADDEFARFTANGLESRSNAEVLSDIAALPLAGGTMTGAAIGKTDTDTSNTGSVTLDFSANQNFVLTLTGNVTLANPSTEAVGQSGFIVLIQDGTGGRTVSLGTDYETAAGAGLTLSSAASTTDIVPYVVAASGRILLGNPQLAFS